MLAAIIRLGICDRKSEGWGSRAGRCRHLVAWRGVAWRTCRPASWSSSTAVASVARLGRLASTRLACVGNKCSTSVLANRCVDRRQLRASCRSSDLNRKHLNLAWPTAACMLYALAAPARPRLAACRHRRPPRPAMPPPGSRAQPGTEESRGKKRQGDAASGEVAPRPYSSWMSASCSGSTAAFGGTRRKAAVRTLTERTVSSLAAASRPSRSWACCCAIAREGTVLD
eukprot:SAG22_NODE_2954_length_2078_cov_2.190500_3_plen_228_part_00